MNTQTTEDTAVVKEKTSEAPILLPEERVEYETRKAIPAIGVFITCLVAFAPPLFIVWSLAVFGVYYYLSKNSRILVTNKRLIYSIRSPFGKYSISSLPLSKIKHLNRKEFGGFWGGLVNRLFGTGDIQVITQEMNIVELANIGDFDIKKVALRMSDVKKPKELIEAIKVAIANAIA